MTLQKMYLFVYEHFVIEVVIKIQAVNKKEADKILRDLIPKEYDAFFYSSKEENKVETWALTSIEFVT